MITGSTRQSPGQTCDRCAAVVEVIYTRTPAGFRGSSSISPVLMPALLKTGQTVWICGPCQRAWVTAGEIEFPRCQITPDGGMINLEPVWDDPMRYLLDQTTSTYVPGAMNKQACSICGQPALEHGSGDLIGGSLEDRIAQAKDPHQHTFCPSGYACREMSADAT